MAISFDYMIDVPASGPWTAMLRTSPLPWEPRIVGSTPSVQLQHFETPDRLTRTRLALVASDQLDALCRELSFVVDREFAAMVRPFDVIHVASGYRGGLGVSVLRSGRLVAAAGAVTAVPLGPDVSLRLPSELYRRAEDIFRERDHRYSLWECPIEVTTESGPRLLHRGGCDIGPYDVFVAHGFVLGRECVAISQKGVCPDCAATVTASLLDGPDGMTVRPFVEARVMRDRLVQDALAVARSKFSAGALDDALTAAYEALAYDRDSDEASFLIQEIERAMGGDEPD